MTSLPSEPSRRAPVGQTPRQPAPALTPPLDGTKAVLSELYGFGFPCTARSICTNTCFKEVTTPAWYTLHVSGPQSSAANIAGKPYVGVSRPRLARVPQPTDVVCAGEHCHQLGVANAQSCTLPSTVRIGPLPSVIIANPAFHGGSGLCLQGSICRNWPACGANALASSDGARLRAGDTCSSTAPRTVNPSPDTLRLILQGLLLLPPGYSQRMIKHTFRICGACVCEHATAPRASLCGFGTLTCSCLQQAVLRSASNRARAAPRRYAHCPFVQIPVWQKCER